MTRLTFLVLITLTAFAETAGIRSVYILPMTGGLDQYLADQITRDHVMQVVADPKLADTVMTDRLNPALGETLAKLHPRDEDDNDADEIHHSFRSSGTNGTVFLVDTKTRQVIWSDYEKPSHSTLRDAGRIVKKLQTTLGK